MQSSLDFKYNRDGEPTRFVLECSYDYAERAKEAGQGVASWQKKDKTWTYPIDPTIYRSLVELIPQLWISPNVTDFLAQMRAHQDAVLATVADQSPLWEGDALWPFQRASVRFIVEAKCCILGHEMGTGKTVIGSAGFRYVQARRVLVICGDKLKWNWADHIKVWASRNDSIILESRVLPKAALALLDTEMIHGARETRDEKLSDLIYSDRDFCLIINYDQAKIHQEILLAGMYDVVLVDEAHRIHNHKTARTKTVLRISRRATYNWLVTGNPLRKNYDDLWSLLHICDPTRFTSFWNFVYLYLKSVPGIFGGTEILGVRDLLQFDAMLTTYAFVKTKAEVMPDLPPKVYQNIKLLMNPNQQKIYDKMEKEFLAEVRHQLKSGEVLDTILHAPTTLAQITRLRQICLNPAIIGGANDSAKLDFLLPFLMDEFKGSDTPVLIFTFYRALIPFIRELVKRVRVPYAEIVGGMSSLELRAIEDQLNRGKLKIIAGTAQSMGEGLNLQAAKAAIFMDRFWVPWTNTQAEDRLHRGEIKTSPKIIYVWHPGTIEDDIIASCRVKKYKADETTGQIETVRNLLLRKGFEGVL